MKKTKAYAQPRKQFRKRLSFLFVVMIVIQTTEAKANSERVDSIMKKMSFDDLIGQMTQLSISTIMNPDATLNETKVREFAHYKVGSYFDTIYSTKSINNTYGFTPAEWRRLITRIQKLNLEVNGHPVLYGVDSVHGANYVQNSVLFGQQINAGATFNPKLVYNMGKYAGRDTLASGIPWIFAPILEISRNSLWARTYETFGEDTHLVSEMGKAIISGLQSNDQVGACMKHFIGYSKLPSGHDREDVSLSWYELLNYFLPPFLEAAKIGAKSVMENYVSLNGIPTVANSDILRLLLRQIMGYEGVLVTDYSEIYNLHDWDNLYH